MNVDITSEEREKLLGDLRQLRPDYVRTIYDPTSMLSAADLATAWNCAYNTALRRANKMVKAGQLRRIENVVFNNRTVGMAFVPVSEEHKK